MKKIILILVISIGLMSYSKSINQLHNKNIKLRRHFYNKFADTEVTAYSKNRKVIYKGHYKNGKKDGEWITYYKNGKIKSKEIYKDGRKISYGTIPRLIPYAFIKFY
ncbi:MULTISPECIES: toxin-antitoxin system YwqK family antitoxin [Psychrilyobacter]|uniref:MORN repeat variant n=1 Tax=Psychrilyobacter piezotolerans TaxID=2293438 RepID=A0ABX9KL24_9FUSO|nr:MULTISPECIES: hypothetical protein [Psychrilyobacter]MCS5422613.1 hypothetical protein [Psychrilyobacter sp. S5]NDI76485.1 hypothetical protein [Psychrilyobacter piezotolerans]RDE66078.1 hypothetical protein DV867_00965 [Psychrilyobacter sp. S5]REI43256.1 hypothetical protein DYH56_00965 [Psychrilyobacter piezotolerans]